MGGIFVSYRRSDSQGEAGRLFDDLAPLFGEHTVFMDVSAIEAGRDFRKAIEEGVTKCGVLLVVIGPEWLNAKDEAGASRLNNPADFVRIETASALKRDIPVIPVLVRSAKMPSADQLPDDLKELAYRNCVELTHARWKSDLELLVEALHRLLDGVSPPGETTVPPPEAPTPEAPKAKESSTRIDSAVLQRVTRELGLYIGQIADIVVKRAAPRASSVEDLYLKVAEEIDSPGERERFLRNSGSAFISVSHLEEASELSTPPPPKSSSNRGRYILPAIIFSILILLAGAYWALSRTSRETVQTPVLKAVPANPETPAPKLVMTPEATKSTRPLAPAEGEPASPRVSLPEEVSRELLFTKVPPVYPIMARQAHIQGVVVLAADVSKDGVIETLKVISGHPLLVPAAIDAAKQFRYKPYLLNGWPVAVNTQIIIRFTLSGG